MQKLLENFLKVFCLDELVSKTQEAKFVPGTSVAPAMIRHSLCGAEHAKS